MRKTFRSIFLSSFIVLSFSFVVLLAGCQRKTKTPSFIDQGEVGEYFSSAIASGASLSLDKNSFTFVAGGTSMSGTYSFDGTNLVLTFDGDSSGVNVTFEQNQVSFTYKGETYTLYRSKNYTVSFNTNGGSSVESQTVRNGQKVSKPSDPTKSGYTFIGWYKDSAYKQPYNFDSEIVTSDTTLYAFFGENTSADSEFSVYYVSGIPGVSFDSVQTFQNTVYNLPNIETIGSKFLGWWVSDYEDQSKLSYQFEAGMKLYEDTVLYAVYENENPAVSVVGNKISWNSLGIGKTYALTVKVADDASATPLFTKNVTTTSETYDFSSQAPGNYIVEVSTGTATGRAFVVNKGLSSVSKFNVEGFTLTWNKVPNATNYSLVIDNSNPNQSTTVELGNVNEFDFTNLLMPANGINFTVVASGNGYANSTSKVYNVFRGLNDLGNVNYDSTSQSLTWSAVDGAESYSVAITDSKGNTFTYSTSTTSYAVDTYYGQMAYAVTPVKAGWYGETVSGNLNKSELSTPKNISLFGYELRWDAVEGAVSYNIKINNESYTSTSNSYAVEQSYVDANESFAITVQAVAQAEANNSFVAQATINKGGVTNVSFANGVATWNAIPGVTKFAVKVDDGAVQNVTGTNKINLSIESGKHSIYVAPADAEGNYNESDFFKYDIDVYQLTYNTMGGTNVANYYYVKGDTVPTLPTPTYNGYSFLGWYVSEDAAINNGEKFNSATFDSESGFTLYAGWKGNEYTVVFKYTETGVPGVSSATVVFGSPYTLPVPQSKDVTKVFNGWYTDENSTGFRFTDQYGKSREDWRYLEGMQLFAGWINVFEFEEVDSGKSYSVSAAEGASYLTEVTIPATYNGKPVSTIEAYAFKDHTKLVRINIPNTITNVETGNSGPNGVGSAFKGCINLTGVYVYEVEGAIAEDVVYSSVDGTLIHKNTINGEVEIAWVPYGTKAGTYTVPSSVTTIMINTFNGCEGITEIVVPASVTTINDSAFTGCRNLENVVFEQAAAGTEEKSLSLGANIFGVNSLMEVLNLPSRVNSFSAATLANCTGLKQVNFVGTFEGASYKSVDGVVYNAEGTTLIYFPRARDGEFVIPTGVTTVGESAFETVRYMTKITIPGHVTTIEKFAFKTTSRLTDIVFLGTANDPRLSIGEQAFYNAGNFTSTFTELVLPANLKVIDKCAFGSMTNITSVKLYSVDPEISFAPAAFGTNDSTPTFKVTDLFISKDVNSFEVAAVFGATKLERIVVEEGNANFKVVDGVLYNAGVTAILYYPSTFTGAFTLPSTITTIGGRVFEEKYGMTAITIPNTVETVGGYAFLNCTNLATVTFEAGGTKALTIGDYAFSNCKALTTISLPDRTSNIGDKAFDSCTGLVTVEIGKDADFTKTQVQIGMTSDPKPQPIYDYFIEAFNGCTSLTAINVSSTNAKYASIDGVLCTKEYNGETPTGKLFVSVCPIAKTGTLTLPDTVSRIEGNAFKNQNGITSITFPATVTALSIKSNAFNNDQTLQSISLPNGLATIESNSFMGCKSLTSIVIPKTVTLIQSSAFTNCESLASVTFETGGLSPLEFADGNVKISEDIESASEATESTYDPMGLISIFAGCDAITEIVLPERTNKIGKTAFGGMKGLTRVVIPSTVTSIGDYAFAMCQNLETVEFAAGCNLTSLGKGAFRGMHSYEPTALNSINLPYGNYTIGDGAFKYTSLETVTIPEGVTGVGTRSFYGNKKLTTVSLPASLTTIGEYAFSDNKSLSTVTLASGSQLSGVGGYAFSNTEITAFSFPTTISKIGHNAFMNCTSLASVTFAEGNSSLSQIGAYAFANTAITTFSFPTAVDSSSNPAIITLGGTVSLGGNSGEENPKDPKDPKEGEKGGEKGKEDPEPVQQTGDVYIFNGCKSLAIVYISESVASIDQLFLNCPELRTITISPFNQNLMDHSSDPIVINLNGNAIRYVYGKITGAFAIPAGITEISPYAFDGQTEITSLTIPSSVANIGDAAFRNCMNLTTVTFEDGSTLNKISNNAFQNCKSLTTVTLTNSITSIGNFAFAGCTSLSSFDFSANIKTLGDYAFTNCGFETLTVPASLTTLGKGVFANNNSLTSVTANATGPYMFANSKALNEVTIGNVQYLGEGMFQNCTALTEITIPASVLRLGGSATTQNSANNFAGYVFDGCTNLATVNMNETAMAVGSYTFRNCTSLTSFAFPNTVINIGEHLFDSCTSLETVTLSSECKYIAQYMFYNCSSLESISMPEKVERIGGTYSTTFGTSTTSYAFYGCSSLSSVEFSNNITGIGTYSFQNCTSLEEVSLPSALTRILASSFEGCSNLVTVTFNQTGALGTLGNYLFRNCTSLKNVENFKSNTNNSFGYGMFTNCTSLETIKVPANIRMTGNETFMGCTSLKSIDFSGTSLYSIGTNAFEGCTSLTTILLPSQVKVSQNFMIAGRAFMNCSSLEEFALPLPATGKGITIGYAAFMGAGIKSFHITKDVTKIEGAAFNNCNDIDFVIDAQNTVYSLLDDKFIVKTTVSGGNTTLSIASIINAKGEVVIPDGLTFEDYSLFGLEEITKLTLPSTLINTPNGGSNIGNNATIGYKGGTVVVPEGVTSLKNTFYNSTFESIVLPSTLTSIDDRAFMNNTNLKSIVIPASVTRISGSAFKNCTSLESVTFNNGLTVIGDNAFEGCTSLTSITFPETLTTIGNSAFRGSGLTSVVIPETLKEVGKFVDIKTDRGGNANSEYYNSGYVFADCKALTTVTYKLTSINSKHMFEGCTALTTITFPNGLTSIDGYAFNGCSALTSFAFDEGLNNVGPYAFSGTGLTTVTLPASLTRLCDGAFANCTKLTSVTFSSGLKYIGAETITALDSTSNEGGVFEGCTALATVDLPDTLFAINGRTFAGCTSIESIVIPNSVSFVGDGAFAGWTSTQTVNSTQSLYTITGLWTFETTENGASAYNADSEAQFVFGYTA